MPGVKSGPWGGSGPTGTVRAPGGAGGSAAGTPPMSGGSWPGTAAAGTPGVKPGPFGLGGDVITSGRVQPSPDGLEYGFGPHGPVGRCEHGSGSPGRGRVPAAGVYEHGWPATTAGPGC